jgi:hypothetical protein
MIEKPKSLLFQHVNSSRGREMTFLVLDALAQEKISVVMGYLDPTEPNDLPLVQLWGVYEEELELARSIVDRIVSPFRYR